MKKTACIIMAAGKSLRMKSKETKVMHKVAGQPMLQYAVDLAKLLRCAPIILVTNPSHAYIKNYFRQTKGIQFVSQKQALGTAHAVKMALKTLSGFKGDVLILSGDVPLLSRDTLQSFLKAHRIAKASLSVITAVLTDATGYGRILRDKEGSVTRIVEERNASPSERLLNEINAGIYWVKSEDLISWIPKIKKDPIKGEFYLTDLISIAASQCRGVLAFQADQADEVLGANTQTELTYLNQVMFWKIASKHLKAGVSIEDPNAVYIDHGVKMAPGVSIGANVHLRGNTKVGQGATIEHDCHLENVTVASDVLIRAYSYLENCTLKSRSQVGPFARIRPESIVEEDARVGNFVELKKTRLGKGSKANHLSYLGDARIGKKVNIGAGNITCNYDGKKKHVTVLQDGVFSGSDVQFVAPVTVKQEAYIAAGTTVTQDVPSGSLAIARVPERHVLGWVKKRRGSKG